MAKTPDDHARALYWHGRVVNETDPAQARLDWTQAFSLDPWGYYGWLSVEQLDPNARNAVRVVSAHDAVETIPATSPDPRVELLMRAGFARYATQALNTTLHPRDASATAWLPFLQRADQWSRVLDIGVAHGDPAALFPRAFPQAFGTVEQSVDPFLLLALMRRESRFDPDATSPAEAIGLLQLLPKTAKSLAHDLDEPPPSLDQLHDPATNVRLGAHYVRLLLDRFRQPLFMMAAYNGGPASVAQWTRERAGMPLDEWVERIPFRETRAYVKAVAGAWAAYSWIYGGRRPAFDLTPVTAAGDGVDY